MRIEDRFDLRLDAELAGETTEERAQLAEIWARSARISPSVAPSTTAKAWDALSDKIAKARPIAPTGRFPVANPTRSRSLQIRGVVGALMALGVAIVAWNYSDSHRKTPTADVFTTGPGELRTVYLNDGTVVTMGAASSLNVPRQNKDGRKVSLVGTAYFAVADRSDSPFQVKVGDATVDVLGTHFGVHRYAGESTTKVFVDEGRVALRKMASPSLGGASQAILSAGDFGQLSESGAVEVVHNAERTTQLGWMAGALSFRDATLSQVIGELERWYDVRITLDNPSLGSTPVTASFANESLEEASHTLGQILNMDVERNGRAIKLTQKKSAHAR